MKFYKFIEHLKKENPNKIVMVKNGAFFNAIGTDAIVLERILGFKRTCHARFLCKCGMPVSYVKENMEKVIKRLKEKNISVILFDELENGRYKYNNKSFDILLEVKGENLRKEEKIDCANCKNNRYTKEINKYTIEKENYEKLMNKIKEMIDNIKKIKIN